MNIGEAIKSLKQGKKVARSGWNGKKMYLILFSESSFITLNVEEGEEVPSTIENLDYNQHIGDEGTKIEHIGITETGDDFYPIYDFIIMKTADNKCVPWLASQTDILAEDWVLV